MAWGSLLVLLTALTATGAASPPAGSPGTPAGPGLPAAELHGPLSLPACLPACTGPSTQTLRAGTSFSYAFRSEGETLLAAGAAARGEGSGGFRLEGSARVHVLSRCHLVLQLRDTRISSLEGRRAEPLPASDELRAELEANPLHFSLQGGLIPRLCPAVGEEIWALNVKRGLLSAVQNSLPVAHGFLQDAQGSLQEAHGSLPGAHGFLPETENSLPGAHGSLQGAHGSLPVAHGFLPETDDSLPGPHGNVDVVEEDVLGRCSTQYRRDAGGGLLKSKDLRSCKHRGFSSSSLLLTALPHDSSGGPQEVLRGHARCSLSYPPGAPLPNATCEEELLFTPFHQHQQRAQGVRTRSRVAFSFDQHGPTEERPTAGEERVPLVRATTLLMERSPGDDAAERGSKSGAHGALRVLCAPDTDPLQAAAIFPELAFSLRGLSGEELRALWALARLSCRANPLKEALPACGSEACVALMASELGSVSAGVAHGWLRSLAFVPEPTAAMIVAVTPLLKSEAGTATSAAGSRAALLSVSALLHNFCTKAAVGCGGESAVRAAVHAIARRLEPDCSPRGREAREQALLALKALGNAGLAGGATLAPVLARCARARGPGSSLELRLAAVDAFRRIPCEADRGALVELYRDERDEAEVRIAAYLLAMHCPSPDVLLTVRLTQRNESSQQVASFVWSHLTQLLDSTDPAQTALRRLLADAGLPPPGPDADLSRWRYSRYAETTLRSGPAARPQAAAILQRSLVFSPDSFVPRSLSLNLTVNAMGQSLNLLELSGRVENVEPLLERLLGVTKPRGAGRRGQPPTTPWGYSPRGFLPGPGHGATQRRARAAAAGGATGGAQCDAAVDAERTRRLHRQVSGRRSQELACSLALRLLGSEVAFTDCAEWLRNPSLSTSSSSTSSSSSFDVVGAAVRLLKGERVGWSHHALLASERLWLPTSIGLPLGLSLNATSAVDVSLQGAVGPRHGPGLDFNAKINPVALVQVSARVGLVGRLGSAGLEWEGAARSALLAHVGVRIRDGRSVRLHLDTPEHSVDVFTLSSKLYAVRGAERLPMKRLARRSAPTTPHCSSNALSQQLGWQLCSELSLPLPGLGSAAFPLPGPALASLSLQKTDPGLRQYVLEATYDVERQGDLPCPKKALLHVGVATPGSRVNRDLAATVELRCQEMSARAEIVHPHGSLRVRGDVDDFEKKKRAVLQLTVDDKDEYFVKGLWEERPSGAERRFRALVEAKVSPSGPPVLASANGTFEPGRAVTLHSAVQNLLSDTATLAGERREPAEGRRGAAGPAGRRGRPLRGGDPAAGAASGRREGLGLRAGARPQLGDGAEPEVRRARGGGGAAARVRHEPGAPPGSATRAGGDAPARLLPVPGARSQAERGPRPQGASARSRLQVSYGTEWQLKSNKKRLLLEQDFSDKSDGGSIKYLVKWKAELPAHKVDAEAALSHVHSLRGSYSRNTSVRASNNARQLLAAQLLWKDASSPQLWAWDGSVAVDSPWLRARVEHELRQPERRSFVTRSTLATDGAGRSARSARAPPGPQHVLEATLKNAEQLKELLVQLSGPEGTVLKVLSSSRVRPQRSFTSHNELQWPYTGPLAADLLLEEKKGGKRGRLHLQYPGGDANVTGSWDEEKPVQNVTLGCAWRDRGGAARAVQLAASLERGEERGRVSLHVRRCSLAALAPHDCLSVATLWGRGVGVGWVIIVVFVPGTRSAPRETCCCRRRCRPSGEPGAPRGGRARRYAAEVAATLDKRDTVLARASVGTELDSPEACVSLKQPYDLRLLPKAAELCLKGQRDGPYKYSGSGKLNLGDTGQAKLSGRYQGTFASWRHELELSASHSFKVKVPGAAELKAEVFSVDGKGLDFNYGAAGKLTLDKKDVSKVEVHANGSWTQLAACVQLSHPYGSLPARSLQACVQAKRQGDGVNALALVRSDGKERGWLALDATGRRKQGCGDGSVRAEMRQAFFDALPRATHAHLSASCEPNKMKASGGAGADGSDAAVDLALLLVSGNPSSTLALSAELRHAVRRWRSLPSPAKLQASLTKRNEDHEGSAKLVLDKSWLEVDFKNDNTFGRAATLLQLEGRLRHDAGLALPRAAQLRAKLQAQGAEVAAQACLKTDDKSACLDLALDNKPQRKELSGKLRHSVPSLGRAGVPADGRLLVTLDHPERDRVLSVDVRYDGKRANASTGLRVLHGSVEYRLLASAQHQEKRLAQLGMPASAQAVAFLKMDTGLYRLGLSGNWDKSSVSARLNATGERRGPLRSGQLSADVQHNVELLARAMPRAAKVSCKGELQAGAASGQCVGRVGNAPVQLKCSEKHGGGRLSMLCSGEQQLPLLRDLGAPAKAAAELLARKVDGGASASVLVSFDGRSLNASIDAAAGVAAAVARKGSRRNARAAKEPGYSLRLKLKHDLKVPASFPRSADVTGTARLAGGKLDAKVVSKVDSKRFFLQAKGGGDARAAATTGSLRVRSKHNYEALQRRGVPRNGVLTLAGTVGKGRYEGRGFASLDGRKGAASLAVTLEPDRKEARFKSDHGLQLPWPKKAEVLAQLGAGRPERGGGGGSRGRRQAGGRRCGLLSVLYDDDRARLEGCYDRPEEHSVTAKLAHNVAALSGAGVPSAASLMAEYAAPGGGRHRASIDLTADDCVASGKGELRLGEKIQWDWASTQPCLKARGLPGKLQIKGSVQPTSCNSKGDAHLTLDGKALALEASGKCADGSYEVRGRLSNGIEGLVRAGVPRDAVMEASGSRKGGELAGKVSMRSGTDALTADGKLRARAGTLAADATATHAWRALSDAGAPRRLDIKLQSKHEGCNVDAEAHVTADGQRADGALKAACGGNPRYSLDALLSHSMAALAKQGVPERSRVKAELATSGPQGAGSVEVAVGACHLGAKGTVKIGKSSTWDLSLNNSCKAAKDVGVPGKVELKGSADRAGCPINLKSLLRYDDRRAELDLDTACGSYSLLGKLKHNVPQLKSAGLPDDNKLSLRADWKDSYRGSAELKSGKCNVKVDGELKLEKKSTWTLMADNKCPRLSVTWVQGTRA
uniref:Uncharacterized protein LOC116941407 n=1 Tax=Petromyzon marinus TaxID=7757 RepID=A0AAJ7WSP4_PETMA|nr:uncharacterized protein LOC116941407 [Petromyzon marinus]